MRLRPCVPDDLNAVRALLEAAELCTDGLTDQFGDPYVVAEIDGEVVGCAGVEVYGSCGLLRSVAVLADRQRRGIGEALVADRLEWVASAKRLETVYLLTTTAAGYFGRFGFALSNREDVPTEIQKTVEFSEACPKSAAAMRLEIRKEAGLHEEGHDMDIKKHVRDRYAEAARKVRDRADTGAGSKASCGCGDSQELAADAITSNLYDADELKGVPLDAALASLGCGNPTALAELKAGEVVLDLGSGGGIDVILSARRVGPTGKAYGLDMTDEMLEVARRNQRKAGIGNVEFLKGDIEQIPLPDNSVDVVISNCVINLSPDKPRALREAFRVLRPGGRFAVSDIVARGRIPESVRRDMELWAGCIAGALEEDQYRTYLEAAGFEGIGIEPTRVFRLQKGCCSANEISVVEGSSSESKEGLFMSAFVRAVKPKRSS